MFGHYVQAPVFFCYALALATAIFEADKGTPTSTFLPFAAVTLWWVDRLVHQRIHKDPLPLPSMSFLLVAGIIAAAVNGLIRDWGVVAALVSQAIWDNSWHSRSNHRDVPGVRADTDSWLWRLAAIGLLAGAILHGLWREGTLVL